MINIIKKLEDSKVPSGRSWKTESRTVRVKKQEFKILKDSRFRAHEGMWHLMEQRMTDPRKGNVVTSINMVRE